VGIPVEITMKCRIRRITMCALLCFFLTTPAKGDEESVRLPARFTAEHRGAGREMKDLRKYAMQTDYQRSLGDIAGFDVTVKYGTVRFERKLWDWGVEFTTLLPNLNPGGPGNRRGIDLF
jgi:hypothetical protein